MVNATYTIEFESDIKLTREICDFADITVRSGMIEEVLDGFISFHDLKGNEVKRALKFIGDNFNKPKCYISIEHYKGTCYCELERVGQTEWINEDVRIKPV